MAWAAGRVSENLGYDINTSLHIDSMWSIVNLPGSHNKSHIHPGSHWSGVYYVQAPEKSGRIQFSDPRTASVMSGIRYQPNSRRKPETWVKVSHNPVAGKMIIFPSWLYHSVEPNLSKDERIIISFNLNQYKS